jgi:hypothetical protein
MNNNEEMIPYIIMEAYPYRNIPSVKHNVGVIEKSNITNKIVDTLVEFVSLHTNINHIETIEHLHYFWKHLYDKQYMDNEPWIALIFINNQWTYIRPNNEELLVALLKEKNKMYISSSVSEDNLSCKTDETVLSIIEDED